MWLKIKKALSLSLNKNERVFFLQAKSNSNPIDEEKQSDTYSWRPEIDIRIPSESPTQIADTPC